MEKKGPHSVSKVEQCTDGAVDEGICFPFITKNESGPCDNNCFNKDLICLNHGCHALAPSTFEFPKLYQGHSLKKQVICNFNWDCLDSTHTCVNNSCTKKKDDVFCSDEGKMNGCTARSTGDVSICISRRCKKVCSTDADCGEGEKCFTSLPRSYCKNPMGNESMVDGRIAAKKQRRTVAPPSPFYPPVSPVYYHDDNAYRNYDGIGGGSSQTSSGLPAFVIVIIVFFVIALLVVLGLFIRRFRRNRRTAASSAIKDSVLPPYSSSPSQPAYPAYPAYPSYSPQYQNQNNLPMYQLPPGQMNYYTPPPLPPSDKDESVAAESSSFPPEPIDPNQVPEYSRENFAEVSDSKKATFEEESGDKKED